MVNETTKALAGLISKQRSECGDEASTCTYVIEPFLREQLGWDASNPAQVKPQAAVEYPGNPEHVDYGMRLGGKFEWLIEAKKLGSGLNIPAVYKQAAGYFSRMAVRILALTNSEEWRFYSDFDRENVMDLQPFRVIRANAPREGDDEFWAMLSRERFNAEAIRTWVLRERTRQEAAERRAAELDEHAASVREAWGEQQRQPSDWLVRGLLAEKGIEFDEADADAFRNLVARVIVVASDDADEHAVHAAEAALGTGEDLLSHQDAARLVLNANPGRVFGTREVFEQAKPYLGDNDNFASFRAALGRLASQRGEAVKVNLDGSGSGWRAATPAEREG